MKLFRILPTVLLFLLVTFASARPWTPNDDVSIGIPVDGAVTIQSESVGIGHLYIHFSNPQVKMERVDLDKRTWTLVKIDGETKLWQTGKPALPLVARAIRLPNTGNVRLVATGGEYIEYDHIDVLPQQPSESKSTDIAYDDKQYATDAFYPTELAQVASPQIVRDAPTIRAPGWRYRRFARHHPMYSIRP